MSSRLFLRCGIAAGLLTSGAVIALSLAPIGIAQADTLHLGPAPRMAAEPQLAVDPGLLQDHPAIVPQGARAPEAPAPAKAPVDDALTLKRVLVVDGPFRHGDYLWDDKGVPAGEVIVTVDIEAQTIAVFRAGYQIGAAVITYGADNFRTPLGTFRIKQKAVDHVSSIYNAPMPYMMRLTDDGVAIHASDIVLGNATHGCIGVPLAFAKLIYGQAKLGTRVIITAGKMMAVPDTAQMTQAALNN